jgi:hypothetical protein
MRMTCLVSAGVVGFVTASGRAEILPTFWPAGCSYKATHIVVVTTEPAGRGRFKVTESWKGDLKPGDALTIPGLAGDAKGDMALFMARDPDPKSADPWKPVSIGKEWRVSVVWFEGEKVLAVEQPRSPGPADKMPMGGVNSRKEFKQFVDYYLDTERAYSAARAIEDPGKRAAAFAKIVNGRYDRQDEAFAELGKCGPPALPALRAYLKGPADYQQAYAVRAMVAAGGKDVVPELHAMLEAELAYWKVVGPKLAKSWWLEDQATNEPWKRFGTLGSLVSVYEDHPTPAYRETVVAVRDLFRRLPVIDKDTRIGNMSDGCDRVLKKGDR